MKMRAGLWLVGGFAFLAGVAAIQLMPAVHAQGPIKAPKWSHGLAVKARTADEKDFTAGTKRIGIEVYRDENNGNWIYVSESGSIAVVAGK